MEHMVELIPQIPTDSMDLPSRYWTAAPSFPSPMVILCSAAERSAPASRELYFASP